MTKTPAQEWLLIFYSVPSHPVSSRMKIWRKLSKAGAVQLKGAVYILPATDEHEEFFQWLIGEVKSMGGDGAFVRSAEIKTMDEPDIRNLFVRRAEQEFRVLDKNLDIFERKVLSIRKGTKPDAGRRHVDEVKKLEKELADIRKRDFFPSSLSAEILKRMQAVKRGLKAVGKASAEVPAEIQPKRPDSYRGRIWITRKKPFIDRMASAWFIRHFIDPQATFRFIDEKELKKSDPDSPAFDMPGGEFTHIGELCTFEVMVKSFGIKDRAVRKIAEIVHDLDVKDNKYDNPDAAGIEKILIGIRKTVKSDVDALRRGMDVFEMLYQSRI